ncbi:MAG: hypothetical protein GY906_29405 [bacterium]|nr:hypothetical protein [bacterium]
MNESSLGQDLERAILSACEKLVDDFSRLQTTIVAAHKEMEPVFLAANLMEFGRGQISGIDEPSDSDSEFIMNFVDNLEVRGERAFLFCSYISGCVLGWVITEQLSRSDMDRALAVAKARSMELYPEGEE